MREITVLTEIIDRYASDQPTADALIFLKNGEEVSERVSYQDLRDRALRVAAALAKRTAKGDRVLLLYPPGVEFVVTFFAALYAGVVAVPLAPPRRDSDRVANVVADCQPVGAIGPGAVVERSRRYLSAQSLGFVLNYEDALNGTMGGLRPSRLNEVAMLQYTSGSTGAPKGVTLSHLNIVENQYLIANRFSHPERFTCVSWLPIYHDMGLIGGILQPLFMGGTAVMMSPFSFLQKPSRWLAAIARFRAHSSGAPNFAYDLCVDRIQDGQLEFDLTAWRVAFVGAEPIRADTLERFATRFSQCGFRREAFYPCYGMAEATLLVTGADAGVGPVAYSAQASGNRPPHVYISSGRIAGTATVQILRPGGEEQIAPGGEGEIVVGGPSVSVGYWGRTAHRTDEAGLPQLRTGDLGFIQCDQLYVTGRLDDRLVIQGRNYHPNDLEGALRSWASVIEPSRCAAFGIQTARGEVAVVATELTARRHVEAESWTDFFADVRRALAEDFDLAVAAVVVVREGQIPVTTSGKVRRSEARRLFASGAWSYVAEWRGAALSGDLSSEMVGAV
ncbi:fatty acyl-AMP ligase [Caulobacter sp. KR2-114]|uniref:fatty acyl-AMP ligase n=1 Tax=Caulobacter sp. KR2-114 TaxID=3400912 RepID=UPI003C0C7F07